MQTGFVGNDQNYLNNQAMDFVSVYVLFMQDSMKIANQFSKHKENLLRSAGRDNPTIPIDAFMLSRAMKIRAVNADQFNERVSILSELNEIKEYLEGSDSDSDSDSDGADITVVPNQEPVELCSPGCDLCDLFRDIESKWETWVPETAIDIYLKGAIERACNV